MSNKIKVIKNKVKKNKQIGGDIFGAMGNLTNSITDLGKSIFWEINSITNMQSDINNLASPGKGTPNVIQGPPPYIPPKL